jgi:hypothetical protein
MYRIIHIATRTVVAQVPGKPAQLAPGYSAELISSLASITLAVGPL